MIKNAQKKKQNAPNGTKMRKKRYFRAIDYSRSDMQQKLHVCKVPEDFITKSQYQWIQNYQQNFVIILHSQLK